MTPSPSPEQSPDQQPGAEKPKQDPMIEALKGGLCKLLQDDIRGAIDPEKVWQYADLRKNELYYRGNQYLDEIYSTDGNLVDYRPINGQWHQENPDAGDSGLYDTVVNDVRGYGRKFIAVLAQQPPNVKAVPNDKDNEVHMRRAKKADRLASKLHGLWKTKEQNRKLFLTYYKNGTAFGHTVFNADGEKYGYTEAPKMEMVPTPSGPSTMNCVQCGAQTPVEGPPPTNCPQCGSPLGPEDMKEAESVMMPQQVGTERYANGVVEHTVESGLRCTTPYDIQELADSPWLLYEYEEQKGRLFLLYPELRDKMLNMDTGTTSAGGSSTQSGQVTRDIASSPSGTYLAPRKNRLLFSQIWLRPSMYQLAQGTVTLPIQEGMPPQTLELRDALNQQYPTGLKITQVSGEQIVKLENERMDETWKLSPPEPAENAYPDPLCKDFMDVQDQTNDFANIQRQTWERAIPQVFIDTRRIDTTYQAKYRQLPASFIPITSGVGGNINDAIGHVPVAKPEPEMDQYGNEQREHGAEIIGITPQIYGGGGVEQTAYATNLKRNQAMLQLSTHMDAAREYWCGVTYNAIMLMAKYSNGTIPSPYAPSTETETVEDLQELLEGGWHFEASDAMAMSWAEKREQLSGLLKENSGNPDMLHMLGFDLPNNIPQLQDELLGMPDWEIPNQDALNKVQVEIRELLKGKPVQQPSQITGEPMDLPSIPVDEFEDDHQFVAQVIKDWTQTEQAMMVRQQNPDGYANVIAFGKAHAGLALPPPGMDPNAPPGPGGPPPPGGGGPSPGGGGPPANNPSGPPKPGGMQPPTPKG